jgi:IclR family mhp operon transcriptional activator
MLSASVRFYARMSVPMTEKPHSNETFENDEGSIEDDKDTIRALSRGLAVLQAINRAGSLTMTGISQTSGVPYPTARRIVASLLTDGMIEREPVRKRYRATALVQTLSSGYQIENQLVLAARPYLVRLTERFMWPISVTTRVGTSVMVRDSTHSLTPMTFHVYHPGYTLPMLESASGRAYLAFCSESERETIIRGLKSLRNAPAISPGRWEAIHNRLKQYREQGYATHSRSYSNEDPGKTSALAVPVYCRGHLVGTMSLTFFVVAMTMETAVETFSAALMEAAANLSSELDTDRFQISVD